MRLFLAIELAPSLKYSLDKLTSQFHTAIRGKWVEQDNLHITLGFIGEVSNVSLPALINNLKSSVKLIKPFTLVIDKIIKLPPQHPRLLALSVKYPAQYKNLQNLCSNAVEKCQLNLQTHNPHITIVRLKDYTNNSFVLKPLNLAFEVANISLMQSTLTPKGPVYKCLNGFKLAYKASTELLRLNIAICVLNPKNEVLLIRSSEHSARDWQFPQGGIEADESLEEAAKRELFEEVGISKAKIAVILKNVYKYYWNKKFLQRKFGHSNEGYIGQEQSIAIMRVSQNRPQLSRNPREASAYKWVPYNKIMKAISPARRGLTRIAMVELNKLITNNNDNG